MTDTQCRLYGAAALGVVRAWSCRGGRQGKPRGYWAGVDSAVETLRPAAIRALETGDTTPLDGVMFGCSSYARSVLDARPNRWSRAWACGVLDVVDDIEYCAKKISTLS